MCEVATEKLMEAVVAKLQATIAELEVKAENIHRRRGDLKQGYLTQSRESSIDGHKFEQHVEHEFHRGVPTLKEAVDVLDEILDKAGTDGESVKEICEQVKKATGHKSRATERGKSLFDFKFVSGSGHGVVVKAYIELSAKYPGCFDVGVLHGRLAFKPAPSYRIVTDSA